MQTEINIIEFSPLSYFIHVYADKTVPLLLSLPEGQLQRQQHFYLFFFSLQTSVPALEFFPKTRIHFITDFRVENCWVSFLTAVLWL